MTAVSDETVNYIARYGGMCRDCADEDGICPRSGLPCADRGKAIRHVLEALSYGLEHGFIKSAALSSAPVNPETTIPGTDDMDKRFAWLEAKAIDMGYVLVPEPEHPDSPHAPVAQEPVATKKVYIKPLRTIVEIQTAYADQIRDWLNASPPATPAGLGADEIARIADDLRSISDQTKTMHYKLISLGLDRAERSLRALALLSRDKS